MDEHHPTVQQGPGQADRRIPKTVGRCTMSIAQFIRESVLRPRLKRSGCLIVYDADRRYREQCVELSAEKVSVIDTSESSIEGRESALLALMQVGQPSAPLEGVLVYVPARRPVTEEQKQADPFALYAECGAVFPKDDGDDYLHLCLRAKPDYATEIRKVFDQSQTPPAFAVIDAIGDGANWPQLRAALNVESAREILVSLLVPSDIQVRALKTQSGWAQEAREFLRATLAMNVKTRAQSWTGLAEELWLYVLFSEFVFDLPAPLPDILKGVPSAPKEAIPIVDDVCHRLRTDPKYRATYIERAEEIEARLRLPVVCASIEDLGVRDTFPFEERAFLRTAIKGITSGNTDDTRRMLVRQKESVWLGKAESQAQWELVRTGLSLIEGCDDIGRQLPDHDGTQGALLDFYLSSLREADRLQREFEQAAGDFIDQTGLMHEVRRQARACYGHLAENVQASFVKHLENAGWPPTGRLANADAFDSIVSDRLKERGRKVAYLMVDALRYELGVALEKQLSEDGPVELQAAYAQLPTITSVGMASLLPGARTSLTLTLEDDSLTPKMEDDPVSNVNQRMDILRKRFGHRFEQMLLNDFVRGKPKIADTVDLLVLRSTEIDSQLENNPETTLGLIPTTLKLIRAALHKLSEMGFRDAVVVTDHGFFLNAHAAAGDVCVRPQGNWPVNAHDRMLLGSGVGDTHSMVLGADKLGIRGVFRQVAMPRSMAPYRAGHLYFHGGASLAEAVVPILVARLDAHRSQKQPTMAAIQISYKNGATRITTRVPVVEVMLLSDDMFSQEQSVDILLEAQDSKGAVVGEPRPGSDLNPATRTVTLMPGQRKQIALRMDEEFSGKFSVKALNPTTLATHSALALETDYKA
jgi:hypothetical protein